MRCETCNDAPPLTCGECCGTGEVNVGGGGGVYADPAAEVLVPCGCDDGYLLCPDCASEPATIERDAERPPPDLSRRPSPPCGRCGYPAAPTETGELLCGVCTALARCGQPLPPRCEPMTPEQFEALEQQRADAFEADLAAHAAGPVRRAS